MIYNNTISDIDSCILEPWRICGEYEDGFTVTVGGNSEEDCMEKLRTLFFISILDQSVFLHIK